MNRAIILLALAACGGDGAGAESVDVEGCEHLAEGPSTGVSGSTAASTGAPGVSDDHRRYDIRLVDDGEGLHFGSVSFAPGEAGDYVIFVGQDGVPITIADAAGDPVTVEDSAVSSPECAEIRGRHVVELGVGTYVLTFGPTSESVVSIVIEHDGEHAEES